MSKKSGKSLAGGRAIIAALVSYKATDTEERIRALTSVVEAQGVEVVGRFVQRRGVSRAPSPSGAKCLDAPMSSATFIGSGKAKELAALAKECSVTVVYFLNDLSATQVKRLSSLTGCKVISCPNVDQLC
jgi:50S ribosomal subunit-associated GTPase HflX